VAGIAHQDVDRQAEFGQPGQLRVAEAVGVAELDRAAFAVGDVEQVGQFAQHPVVGPGGERFIAAAVRIALDEQVFGDVAEAFGDPALLLLDDLVSALK
jgi:hypothetical protein